MFFCFLSWEEAKFYIGQMVKTMEELQSDPNPPMRQEV